LGIESHVRFGFRFSNENIVLGSARFFVEHQQLEHRVRLDIPTLADPVVRDLLQESDLFARSFNGGGFGLLSPLDFVHVLSLTTEIMSHIWLVISLTRGATHFGVLLLSIFSAMLPLLLTRCNFSQRQSDPPYNATEARAAARHERMRNLAYSDAHRPEIALFGLGDWILKSWSSARKIVLASEQPHFLLDSSFFARINLSDLLFALQNVSLVRLCPLLTACTNSDILLDTTRSTNANVVCNTGIPDFIPQLHSIARLCMWQLDHDNENGFSGHIPDVCILH
jgi:hypothetical protein